MSEIHADLVHIRTPTYKRPDALRRALQSLVDQSWPHWICDVHDDDPDGAAAAICAGFGDPRIRYTHNVPQLFASKNIDRCFTAENPHAAAYFCVVEDDNWLMPTFLAENIALCRGHGVEIVLRNQLVEHGSGTDRARLGDSGVLDDLFVEGRYEGAEFRLSLLAGIGVSNGGLFWSHRTRSALEIHYGCTATLQEYLRTYSIQEPVYVAMEPLAVWAENAEQTTRNAELKAGYLRRELDLKRAVQALRRRVWAEASPAERAGFLTSKRFAAPAEVRARTVAKALIGAGAGSVLPGPDAVRLWQRGLLIRLLGRVTPEFHAFVQSRERLAARALPTA